MQALNQRVQLGQILSEELFEFCTFPSIWQDMIFNLQHINLYMDFLIDGQISSFCPDQSEAEG